MEILRDKHFLQKINDKGKRDGGGTYRDMGTYQPNATFRLL